MAFRVKDLATGQKWVRKKKQGAIALMGRQTGWQIFKTAPKRFRILDKETGRQVGVKPSLQAASNFVQRKTHMKIERVKAATKRAAKKRAGRKRSMSGRKRAKKKSRRRC